MIFVALFYQAEPFYFHPARAGMKQHLCSYPAKTGLKSRDADSFAFPWRLLSLNHRRAASAISFFYRGPVLFFRLLQDPQVYPRISRPAVQDESGSRILINCNQYLTVSLYAHHLFHTAKQMEKLVFPARRINRYLCGARIWRLKELQ